MPPTPDFEKEGERDKIWANVHISWRRKKRLFGNKIWSLWTAFATIALAEKEKKYYLAGIKTKEQGIFIGILELLFKTSMFLNMLTVKKLTRIEDFEQFLSR